MCGFPMPALPHEGSQMVHSSPNNKNAAICVGRIYDLCIKTWIWNQRNSEEEIYSHK